MKRILVFPGAWQEVKNYKGYEGVEIWLKNVDTSRIPGTEWYIGHSIGANFILAHHNSLKCRKFIFVNPLVRKRSIGILVLRWMVFLFFWRRRQRKVGARASLVVWGEKGAGVVVRGCVAYFTNDSERECYRHTREAR